MPITINNEEYLTREEAAELLGVTPQWFTEDTVPRYNLQVFRHGINRRTKYYKRSDVEALSGLRPEEKNNGHK